MQSPYIYQYIANTDPQKAAALCADFGYNCNDVDDIVNSLFQITSQGGEPALQKVMELHPDKELILEFNRVQGNPCSKCPILNTIKEQQFLGANGNTSTGSSAAQSQLQSGNNNNMQALFSTIENNKMMVFLGCLTLITVTVIITQSKK